MKKLKERYLPVVVGKYLNLLFLFNQNKATQIAFNIFCTPRKGHIKPHQEQFLKTAKREKVTVGRHTLQTYEWSGKSTTVLLVHGWESNSFRWKKLIPELQSKGYRVIAFDAPAHGDSSGKTINVLQYAKCINELIKQYHPEYIIGHSIGGMATIYHQYKYKPSSIKGTVVLGAPSELSRIMSDYQNLLHFNLKLLKKLNSFFKTEFSFYFDEFSAAEQAKSIEIEGLIIHDEEDSISPFSESQNIHKNWKQSTFIPTRGLGHSLQDAEVYEHIVNFIKVKNKIVST